MPDLIDKDREMECQQPSRILITKLFIDAGASISFQTEVTEMTPLHWLAYWGDYWAMLVALNKNKTHLKAQTDVLIDENDFI